MQTNIYDNQYIYLSKNIPNTIMKLDQWSMICVTGKDRKKYLNNQFTIDINLIHKNEYQIGAHCNINGKVWTSFLIFKYDNCYLYIVRSSTCNIHIKMLRKYSLFSEIKIFKEKNFFLFGLYLPHAYKILGDFFTKKINRKNNMIVINDIIILKINNPIKRFLIIIPKKKSNNFLNFIEKYTVYNSDAQWLAMDIESGFPILDQTTSGRFILQTLDLKKWNAVSFKKGCYYGQEILCKYENKQINKFIICSLISDVCILHTPVIYENIQYCNESGDQFYVGKVLSWVRIYSKQILLQIRIKKKFFKKKNIFSISSCPNSLFKPYIL